MPGAVACVYALTPMSFLSHETLQSACRFLTLSNFALMQVVSTHVLLKQVAVRGTPDNPMTRQEVDDKAFELMAPILGHSNTRSLIDKVWEIEVIDNVQELRPLMVA